MIRLKTIEKIQNIPLVSVKSVYILKNSRELDEISTKFKLNLKGFRVIKIKLEIQKRSIKFYAYQENIKESKVNEKGFKCV